MATKYTAVSACDRLSRTSTYASAARRTEKRPVTPAPIRTIRNVVNEFLEARNLRKRSRAQLARRSKRTGTANGYRKVENSDRSRSMSFDKSGKVARTHTYSSAARRTKKRSVTPAPMKTRRTEKEVFGARKVRKKAIAQSARKSKRTGTANGSRNVEDGTKAHFDKSEKASGSRQVSKKQNNQSARTKHEKIGKSSGARKGEKSSKIKNKKVAPFEGQKVENTRRQHTQSRNRKFENRSTEPRRPGKASKPRKREKKLFNLSNTIRPQTRRGKVTRKHEPSDNHDSPVISPEKSPPSQDSELISPEIFSITAESQSPPKADNNGAPLQLSHTQNGEESEVVKSDNNNKEGEEADEQNHDLIASEQQLSQVTPSPSPVHNYVSPDTSPSLQMQDSELNYLEEGFTTSESQSPSPADSKEDDNANSDVPLALSPISPQQVESKVTKSDDDSNNDIISVSNEKMNESMDTDLNGSRENPSQESNPELPVNSNDATDLSPSSPEQDSETMPPQEDFTSKMREHMFLNFPAIVQSSQEQDQNKEESELVNSRHHDEIIKSSNEEFSLQTPEGAEKKLDNESKTLEDEATITFDSDNVETIVDNESELRRNRLNPDFPDELLAPLDEARIDDSVKINEGIGEHDAYLTLTASEQQLSQVTPSPSPVHNHVSPDISIPPLTQDSELNHPKQYSSTSESQSPSPADSKENDSANSGYLLQLPQVQEESKLASLSDLSNGSDDTDDHDLYLAASSAPPDDAFETNPNLSASETKLGILGRLNRSRVIVSSSPDDTFVANPNISTSDNPTSTSEPRLGLMGRLKKRISRRNVIQET